MNGSASKIEIFKPFGEGFELMKKILFQPFDLKKWLVLGFAAFLAGLTGGFNSPFNSSSRLSDRDNKAVAESVRQFGSVWHMEWWVILLIIIAVLLVLTVILALMWVGARGRFVFTDCVVHNRAAIAMPWKEFRIEGNSFFLFSLATICLVVVLVTVAAVGLIVPFVQRGEPQPGVGFWIGISVFVFFVACLVFAWSLITRFMVPIMYRQRCRAWHAFVETIELITSHPGPILLYFLFLIVITIGAAMISCAAACVTCCIAAIPYVGTVILLPIPVTFCAFSLLFLRQFGPDYDVWNRFMPPEFLPAFSSTPPVPPPPTQLNPPEEPPSLPIS